MPLIIPNTSAYNLGNFLRTLATPDVIADWSLTRLREKLIKIGAKVVSHGRSRPMRASPRAEPTARLAEAAENCRNHPASTRIGGFAFIAIQAYRRPVRIDKNQAQGGRPTATR
jgi:hypothetical protein